MGNLADELRPDKGAPYGDRLNGTSWYSARGRLHVPPPGDRDSAPHAHYAPSDGLGWSDFGWSARARVAAPTLTRTSHVFRTETTRSAIVIGTS